MHGVASTDPYIEARWATALGPTAVLLARRLGFELQHRAEYRVDAADLARSLGVGASHDGPSVGRSSPLMRAVGRLERFGILTHRPDGPEAHLLVWRQVPGLSTTAGPSVHPRPPRRTHPRPPGRGRDPAAER